MHCGRCACLWRDSRQRRITSLRSAASSKPTHPARSEMGIQGLLPLLKSISDPVHVSSYGGQRVGVDAYSWLHRGAHTCATDLALGLPTDRHLHFCMTRVKLLLSLRVSVVMVFDGGRLPSKRGTEVERSVRRKKERTIGLQLHEQGQQTAAMKAFQKAISITPRMTHQLIRLCQQLNDSQSPDQPTVECIVAPYEADAQLAYLSHSNYVAAVISEDSDLLVFGCKRVLYKMDNTGHGMEIKLRNLAANTDPSFHGWTHSQFQQMAVLAGCDYLPSLPQLGIKKAHTLIKTAKDWHRAIKKLRLEGKVRVYEEYERDFECALLCFQHQRVWEPVQRCVRHLTELTVEVAERYANLSFLGPEVEPEVAQRIADGEVHPTTLEPFTDDDMAGVGQLVAATTGGAVRDGEGSMAGLRRAQSEVVTADVDVAPLERGASVVDGLVRKRREPRKSGMSDISQLLVRNTIDGYCVRVSQATRTGFVPPRSTHKEAERADDGGPATAALTRSLSSQSPPHTARRSKTRRTTNPFAAYAYVSNRTDKEEDDGDNEEDEVVVHREDEQLEDKDESGDDEIQPTSRTVEDMEAEAEQRTHTRQRRRLSTAQLYADDMQEEEDNGTHSRLLMHAYSLPLRSYHRHHPLEDEPPPVPPDDLDALTWPDLPSTTFADTTPLSQHSQPRLSPSPSPSQSPSPSPSPSPPPAPVTGAVFSKYFPQSSSIAPSTTPLTVAPAHSQCVRRQREEVVIDDDDDSACIVLDDDKENVDTLNLRPLSHLDGDLDEIEDDESPNNHCTRTAAPSPPPLRFGNKRETQSTGAVLHTPQKAVSKPLQPNSAPPPCLPSSVFAPYRQQSMTPHSSSRIALPPAPRAYGVTRIRHTVSAVMSATSSAPGAFSSTSKRSSSPNLSQPTPTTPRKRHRPLRSQDDADGAGAEVDADEEEGSAASVAALSVLFPIGLDNSSFFAQFSCSRAVSSTRAAR